MPITHGGSGRTFYRMHFHPGGENYILMHYELDRPDNKRFVPVTRYLEDELGVSVPKLHGFDEAKCLVWLEDLGEMDLWTQRQQPWSMVEPLYRSTLDEVWKLHSVSECESPCEFEPAFDAVLYRWEQHYFYEHFLLHQSRLKPTEIEDLYEDAEWESLATDLASLPRFLVHRDFQSRNVMVYQGKVHLIDYQGLRWGRPEYDLASILLDPYVTLGEEHCRGLLEYYHGEYRKDSWETFYDIYLRCAAQRLMQALGAYGNLGRNLGKSEFLEHIPTALERLRLVLAEGNLLPSLQEAIKPENLTLN